MASRSVSIRETAQPGDDRENLRLWLRLLGCTTAIEKHLQRRLAAEFSSSLTRFDILATLERQARGMTMSELAAALLVSNGNVTGRVQTLRRDGFVQVVQLRTDQRVSMVSLTPAGREHFAAMAAAHHGWVEEQLGGMPVAEREQLSALLSGLKDSLPDENREPSE